MSFPSAQPPADPMTAEQPLPASEVLATNAEGGAVTGQAGLLPSRPALVIDYAVKLDPEVRTRLGKRVVREIDRYRAATEGRRSFLQEWRRDAEMMPNTADGPWDNSAAVRAPFTAISCAGHATRLNAQIIGASPPFSVVARKADVVPLADAIGEVLASQLEEAEWEAVARDVHQELPVAGNCAVRVQWVQEEKRKPQLQVEFREDAHATLLDGGADPNAAYRGAVETGPDGQAKIFLGWKTETIRDGIELKLVKWEDLVILPATCKSPDAAYAIGERVMIRGGDLKRGAKKGRYFQDAVDELLGARSDSRPQDWRETDENQGMGGMPEPDDEEPEHREYECYEFCWLDDFNDDGDEEWYILTVHYGTGKVLRCQYSPYEHGEPYYVPFRYITRPGELWAQGVAERIAVPQDAATALSCQMLDIVDLITAQAGNFFYDEESGLDINKFQFEPGRPVKVDSVKGILPMTFSAGLTTALNECRESLGILKEWTDLLAATSNPTLGRETDTQKTLGEVQLVLSQGMQIFEDYASGVALSWAKVWDLVRWNVAQYSANGVVEYRKSAAPQDRMVSDAGESGGLAFKTLPAHVLTSDVDLVPAGSSQYADAQMRLQRSVMLYNLALQNPIIAQNPQLLMQFFGMLLHDARCPEEANLMDQIRQMLEQMAAQQQQQQQMEQLQALIGAQGEQDPAGDAKQHLGLLQQLQSVALNHQKLTAGGQQAPGAAPSETPQQAVEGHALQRADDLMQGGARAQGGA